MRWVVMLDDAIPPKLNIVGQGRSSEVLLITSAGQPIMVSSA
jgi:hypothetical protein